MILDQEIQTYRAKKEELLIHEGDYVLISGDAVLGIYKAREDALAGGYEKVGVDKAFLVKRIEQVEVPLFFPRDFKDCPV